MKIACAAFLLVCAAELAWACGPGYYTDSQRRCRPCPAGHYSTDGSVARCLSCPAGSYTPVAASSSCALCPVGTFASLPGRSECTPCPLATISTVRGARQCTSCPEGQTTLNLGGRHCISCPRGSFPVKSADSVSCTPARVGHFAALAHLTDTRCADGYVAPLEGMSACLPCPEGSVSSDDHTECTPCGRDFFSDGAPPMRCVPCTDEIGPKTPQCFNAYLNGTIYVSDQDDPRGRDASSSACSADKIAAVVIVAIVFLVVIVLVIMAYRARKEESGMDEDSLL